MHSPSPRPMRQKLSPLRPASVVGAAATALFLSLSLTKALRSTTGFFLREVLLGRGSPVTAGVAVGVMTRRVWLPDPSPPEYTDCSLYDTVCLGVRQGPVLHA
eukprot:6172916-Prymnesium_polylepis.1